MRIRSAVLVLALVGAACSASAAPTTTEPRFDRFAREYAATAERALVGTPYEELGVVGLADVLTDLCAGLGTGSVPAEIDGLGITAPAADREVLTEVLERGVATVCPGRASVDVAAVFIGAVEDAIDAGGVVAALDQAAALRAAPRVCERFDDGVTAEAVLLGVVADLFGIEAESVDGLVGLIDGDQGFIAGAVLTNAAGILCPEHLDSVADLVGSL